MTRVLSASRSRVLFDVDGTLIDAGANQRRVWHEWSRRHGLDGDEVYRAALRSRPLETIAQVLPGEDLSSCLAEFQALEDEDVLVGEYTAFAGAADLLWALPSGWWALVTSNYEHRVRGRFDRTGLPAPSVIVDAAAVSRGKPSPAPYLLAAARMGVRPADCLVIEDSPAGAGAGLRAGMTVWTVNGRHPVAGAHRHYATLQEAAPQILRAVGPSGALDQGGRL